MKYHIAAVSRMTDLSIDVIRSWERRYNIVAPERDRSGMRVYNEEAVRRLRLARTATQRGHPIRLVATMSNDELERIAASEQGDRGETPVSGIVNRILDAVHKHDAREAERVLWTAALVMPTRALVLEVLAPVLRAVGDQWEDGRIGVWQEHLLSTLIRNTAGALSRNASAGAPMIFATPPFELHEFGIALAALLAADHGRAVVNLGSCVPVEDLVAATKRMKPSVVVIGMTRRSLPLPSAIEYAQAVAAALPRDVNIWLGGSAAASVAGEINRSDVHAVETLEAFDDHCAR